MLDKQDITLLQDMMGKTIKVALEENNRIFKQELKREWRNDFRDILVQNNLDLKREIRDEVHSLLRKTKREIIDEITEFLDQAILPQIHELQVGMGLVKNHLKLA
jgi:DNA topoisomerase VI subunit B